MVKFIKTETIEFKSFIRNDYELVNKYPVHKLVKIGAGLYLVMIPNTVKAATADATMGNVWEVVMNIVDWVAVGVFTFAGVAWMMNHRTKGLEFLIGGSIGYLIARHAKDIQQFLKTI